MQASKPHPAPTQGKDKQHKSQKGKGWFEYKLLCWQREITY